MGVSSQAMSMPFDRPATVYHQMTDDFYISSQGRKTGWRE
jgi:hypothetical protein